MTPVHKLSSTKLNFTQYGAPVDNQSTFNDLEFFQFLTKKRCFQNDSEIQNKLQSKMRKYGRGSTIGHSAFSFMTTYMSNLCRFLYHFVKNMRLISKLKIHKYMIISHYHVGYLLNVKEEIYNQLNSFQSLYCTNALENCDLDLHFNLDLTFSRQFTVSK